MDEPLESLAAFPQLADRLWRLNNLYTCLDKEGRRVPFRLNWAQQSLLDELHHLNVILKARQLGFTTFIQLFMLDACLFNSNIRAGTIAHKLEDARVIFRDKVKSVYDHLPEPLRKARPIVKDSADELVFSNGSSIRVSTSMRSGTLQYLHVSEYGQVCARYPEKAREIRTGALNTVQAGQVVFIESTAEGQEGHFFDLCEGAQSKMRRGEALTEMDFKFHFFPWHKAPEYTLAAAGVTIPDGQRKYFETLEATEGIVLSTEQKAWYAKKAEIQLSDMKREFPSTPKEAFEASIEGAYYGELLAAAEIQGRIGEFEAVSGIPVDTAWDIGVGDATSIWFVQRLGSRNRLLGYYESSGEGLRHYVDKCLAMSVERNWLLGEALWPHDGRVREWGSGLSRTEQFKNYTGKYPRIVKALTLDDGIAAVRAILPQCEFDAAGCSEGLKALKAYRKEWDEERATWRDKPRHDWASHGADAFRTLATRYREPPPPPPPPPYVNKTELIFEAMPDGRVVANMTIPEWAELKRRKRMREEA